LFFLLFFKAFASDYQKRSLTNDLIERRINQSQKAGNESKLVVFLSTLAIHCPIGLHWFDACAKRFASVPRTMIMIKISASIFCKNLNIINAISISVHLLHGTWGHGDVALRTRSFKCLDANNRIDLFNGTWSNCVATQAFPHTCATAILHLECFCKW
jgi:hypothetical protein